ncbi:BZ3500_MvSof-1268-A1-R1_Chr8-1g09740 [Microbotryum saponariae]|uniref:BZ3500_MvSof-1268-A1-R1_Chr8-1g09740 protein n=1 Tax=Microbotryum saponariae TaxID=289078 RepID=A0A2X0LI05_9BASI|nr:BZ3500_MvSof-1268-A1-R1_Chr8-1g09740 [Microbotryum saponariae]SDA08026.1 BZ3501_MvSof-1269-A2-R1_Chr8-1g09463 [Microbotryum saponariae]
MPILAVANTLAPRAAQHHDLKRVLAPTRFDFTTLFYPDGQPPKRMLARVSTTDSPFPGHFRTSVVETYLPSADFQRLVFGVYSRSRDFGKSAEGWVCPKDGWMACVILGCWLSW